MPTTALRDKYSEAELREAMGFLDRIIPPGGIHLVTELETITACTAAVRLRL